MDDTVESVIIPRTRDLGNGFLVKRALPAAQRRMVGPFIFFDQMGPNVFEDAKGLDVRPHPHIGLATVTYLFEGEVLHRDSLGTVQPIRPGDVNWMTAGRGIVHSERTPPERRRSGEKLFGIQSWIALPKKDEEITPSFNHFGAAQLPSFDDRGARVRVILGSLFGARSPVPTLSETIYADAALAPGASLTVPPDWDERGVYVAEGELEAAGERFSQGSLVLLRPGAEVKLTASAAARLLVLGGDPMDGSRHIWWNFVSSSRERIEQAKQDWRQGRLGEVPGDPELIPLPEEEPPPPVRYP